MRATRLLALWARCLRGSGDASDDWARREVVEQQRSGVERRKIIERLAQQLYAEDLRELGFLADMGLLPWQTYLGAAREIVDCLTNREAEDDGTGLVPRDASGGKAA